jgi:hypothetical protein
MAHNNPLKHPSGNHKEQGEIMESKGPHVLILGKNKMG